MNDHIWNPLHVLTREERAILRATWEAIRGPQVVAGLQGAVRIEDAVPHLAASLETLTGEGYGLQDIANTFGVHNTTVRHWLRRFGLKTLYMQSRGRVWSDAHNKFVPITGELAARLHIRSRRPTPPSRHSRRTALAIANATRLARHVAVCLRGHPFDQPNTYVGPANGKRYCRACRAIYQRGLRAKLALRERLARS